MYIYTCIYILVGPLPLVYLITCLVLYRALYHASNYLVLSTRADGGNSGNNTGRDTDQDM